MTAEIGVLLYGAGETSGIEIVALAALFGLAYLSKGIERVRDWRAPTDLERAHDAYTTGDIDEREFERRLDYLMDPRNEEIKEIVSEVSGIGDVRAKEVALSFDSVDELRRADRDALESVPDIGPELAGAILERI